MDNTQNTRRKTAGSAVVARGKKPVPAEKGTLSRQEKLEKIGFAFNESGKLKGINGNIFARKILSKWILLYTVKEKLFYLYEDGFYRIIEEIEVSDMIRQYVNRLIPDCWNTPLENQYMPALKREALTTRPMDSERDLLNLENGMLDIRSMKLMLHDPVYGSTIRIPVKYDPKAQCPLFLKFANEVFCGREKLIQTVQEMMGYALTSEVRAQVAFLLYGGGANGKSVLAEIIKELCGVSNVCSVSLSELGKSFNRLALFGKTLNLVTECSIDSNNFQTDYFKAIVTGDPISAEIKCGPMFVFKPFVKMIFGVNKLPYTRDKSYGMARRILIIPFDRKFKGKDADPYLADKLRDELPGIMNFALKGLVRLRKNKFRFTVSEASASQLSEYQEISNPLSSFVKSMLEQGNAQDKLMNADAYKMFQDWCDVNGHPKLKATSRIMFHANLKTELKDLGWAFEVSSGGDRHLKGIRVKTEPEGEPIRDDRTPPKRTIRKVDSLDEFDEEGE